MKAELAKQLFDIYPKIFTGIDLLMPISMFGIECDDGWFEILKKCINDIKFLCEKHDLDIEVHQIKEKYGTLRFYVQPCYDCIDNVLLMTELKSSYTCEQCGNPGKIRKLNWIQTLCEECLQKIESKV